MIKKYIAIIILFSPILIGGCTTLERANPLDTTTTTTSTTTTTQAGATTTTTTTSTTTTTVSGAPAAPTGVTAVPQWYYSDEIEVSWYVNTEPDLAGYNVYRSTSESGTYGKINPTLVSKTSTSYTDSTGLSYPTVYYYKVTAVDTDGNESAYSAAASSKSRKE